MEPVIPITSHTLYDKHTTIQKTDKLMTLKKNHKCSATNPTDMKKSPNEPPVVADSEDHPTRIAQYPVSGGEGGHRKDSRLRPIKPDL